MNTHTPVMHTRGSDKTDHTHRSRDIALAVSGIVLIAVAAIAIFVTNQPAAVAIPVTGRVTWGNALEMQYAQPWLEKNNFIPVTGAEPPVLWGNAMEMQYAQPWIIAADKPVFKYGNALEMQYAQPWLEKMSGIPVTGGNPAVTRIFTTAQIPLNCHVNLELLYACKYGYGLP